MISTTACTEAMIRRKLSLTCSSKVDIVAEVAIVPDCCDEQGQITDKINEDVLAFYINLNSRCQTITVVIKTRPASYPSIILPLPLPSFDDIM